MSDGDNKESNSTEAAKKAGTRYVRDYELKPKRGLETRSYPLGLGGASFDALAKSLTLQYKMIFMSTLR